MAMCLICRHFLRVGEPLQSALILWVVKQIPSWQKFLLCGSSFSNRKVTKHSLHTTEILRTRNYWSYMFGVHCGRSSSSQHAEFWRRQLTPSPRLVWFLAGLPAPNQTEQHTSSVKMRKFQFACECTQHATRQFFLSCGPCLALQARVPHHVADKASVNRKFCMGTPWKHKRKRVVCNALDYFGINCQLRVRQQTRRQATL